MTTLLDKQRSATSNVQSSDEATLDQVLLRIAALAPMVAARSRHRTRSATAGGARVRSQVGTDLQHARTPALRRAWT
jgi:hypothetical protein